MHSQIDLSRVHIGWPMGCIDKAVTQRQAIQEHLKAIARTTMSLPDWSGERAFIVCSGPSLTASDCEKLRGEKVVAINNSIQLAPFAQILYACDYKWWAAYPHLWQDFQGLKISAEEKSKEFGVMHIPYRRHVVLCDDALACGGNSGYQVCNLLYLMGVKSIYLLGADCKPSGDKNHWHPDHFGMKLNNPTRAIYKQWIDNFTALHAELKKRGVELVNCSRDTALTIPRQSLESVLCL